MKNKLLISSALAGSLMFAGVSANAQTTVSGNLNVSYKAVAVEGSKADSFGMFGKESQINLQSKGKLNNGWDYAAGFSIEMDGTDWTGSYTSGATDYPGGATTGNFAGAHLENNYIDIISGNTTVSFSIDHFQNSDFTIANKVGFADPEDMAAGIQVGTTGSSNAARAPLFIANTNSAYQFWGVGVSQKTDVGTFGILYNPNASTVTMNDIGNGATKKMDQANSRYEISFRGDLGVKGLDAFAFYNNSATDTPGTTGSTNDVTGERYGFAYNIGNVTVAAERARTNAKTDLAITSDALGISYAATKDLSVGYTHAKSKTGASATGSSTYGDETIKMISVGYSLGAITTGVQFAKVANMGGFATSDGDSAIAYLRVGF